jgi:hypothetical protein
MPLIGTIHLADARRRATSTQRRLAWARALMDRFAHSVMPARRVEQRLLERAGTSMLREHWFAPQIHVSWHPSVVTTLQRVASTSVAFTSAPAHRFTLFQALVAREYQSHRTTSVRTTVCRHSMVDRLQTVTMQTTAMTLVPGMPAMWISRSTSHPVVEEQKRVGAERSVVTRVLREHGRLEEPMAPAGRVLLQRGSPAVGESPFGGTAPPPPPRPGVQHGGWSAVTPGQGLNISQITDEVVRQLDSRLIAARERFGNV